MGIDTISSSPVLQRYSWLYRMILINCKRRKNLEHHLPRDGSTFYAFSPQKLKFPKACATIVNGIFNATDLHLRLSYVEGAP